jgi:hypothetical protein
MFSNKIFYVSGEINDAQKLQQVLVENGGKICATPTFLSGLNRLVQKEDFSNEYKPQESSEHEIFVVVDRFEGVCNECRECYSLRLELRVHHPINFIFALILNTNMLVFLVMAFRSNLLNFRKLIQYFRALIS